MAQFVDLRFDGPIDRRVAMAVHIDPKAGNAVQVPLAVDIDQITSLRPVNDERFFVKPILHLRERMPKIFLVPIR